MTILIPTLGRRKLMGHESRAFEMHLQGLPRRSRRIEEQDWDEISIGMRCTNGYLNVSQEDMRD